jgi:DNA replication protein DnaC
VENLNSQGNIQELEPSLKENEEPERKELYRLKALKTIKQPMVDIGISPRYLDAEMNDFHKKYNEIIKESLYLVGPRGVGKTHLMSAMAKQFISENVHYSYYCGYKTDKITKEYKQYREFADDGNPWMMIVGKIKFISVPELLLRIRASFKTGSDEDESAILEYFSEKDILFLDDMGSEKTTEWVLQTLYLLIDRRYRDMKKTIISSNLTLDELAQKLDDRIASRIAGMCKVIEIKGKDRRLNK